MNPWCRVRVRPARPTLRGTWGEEQLVSLLLFDDRDQTVPGQNQELQSSERQLPANTCRMDQLLTNLHLRSYVQHRVGLMTEYENEFI